MTTITLSLNDLDSIKDAIQKLKDYKAKIEENMETVAESLAGEGTKVAKRLYSNVHATVSTEDDPQTIRSIRMDFTKDAYRHIDVYQEAESENAKNIRYVVGNGEGVGFAEFGAGAYSDYAHPYAPDAPFPVYAGSWSEQDAQEYLHYGKWWFANLVYYGIEPARGLYEAQKTMAQMARKQVIAVFQRGNRL